MNVQILQGRIGQKELKTLESGAQVLRFSVATSERYKNKAGEKIEETTWHNCQAWGKTAEIIDKYFDKGKIITVHGNLKTRKWETKDGQNRTEYFTKVNSFEFPLTEKREAVSSNGTPSEKTDDDLPF
jgi:single-strand DNA-binding protein